MHEGKNLMSHLRKESVESIPRMRAMQDRYVG